MASSVHVEAAAIKSGIGVCKTSIHELQSASKSLHQSYESAGSGGWRDEKYARLGAIVEECRSSLEKPIGELEGCQSDLQELLSTVHAYDQAGL